MNGKKESTREAGASPKVSHTKERDLTVETICKDLTKK